MDKNTQQPVAWLKYPRKKPELMQVSLSELLPVALKNSGWVSVPLYEHQPSQPVPRDVLMALAAEVRNEVCRAATEIMGVEWFYVDGDLAAIADRYASQARRRVRTHTESYLAAVERVRESHQKFVEETGIDYAALVASGFDANSGVQVQPEPSLADRQIKHMLALETALSKLIDKVAPGLLLDGDILDEAEEAMRIADAKPEPVNQQLLARWLVFGRAMQKAGSELPRHLIADTEAAIAAAIDAAEAAQPVGATCASQSAASESQAVLCRNGEVHASSAQPAAVPEIDESSD